jgi:type VI secretion system protein ImpM
VERARRAGALGKLPRQADFVRLNAGSAPALLLHRWLEAAVEGGPRSTTPPTSPVRFLFTVPGQETALVGALAPSRDSVGRAFPLALFTEEHAGFLAQHLGSVPTAFEPFLVAAEALLAEAGELGPDALADRMRALPEPADLPSLDRWRRRVLAEHRGAELLSPLASGAPAEARYYAVSTFLTGCAAEQHQEQGPLRIILECPLAAELGPLPWLELAARRLRWRHTPPALLWTSGDPARLWLGLGAAVPALLAPWLRPGASRNVWPLSTSRPQALAQARNALSASQRSLIDSPAASLEDLLDALAP